MCISVRCRICSLLQKSPKSYGFRYLPSNDGENGASCQQSVSTRGGTDAIEKKQSSGSLASNLHNRRLQQILWFDQRCDFETAAFLAQHAHQLHAHPLFVRLIKVKAGKWLWMEIGGFGSGATRSNSFALV